MSEPGNRSRSSIPEEILLCRLAQSEQMREFFVQMWLQNPQLARRAGRKVQDILSPVSTSNSPKLAAARRD